MSAPRKPQSPGGNKPVPSLTRLKTLPLADREVIYGWTCDANKTLTDVRGEIRSVYSISLSSDSQLSRFRDWQFLQARTERLNNFTEELEERLKEFNPDASRDQVRNFLLSTLMKEAAASGDQKLALEILDRDLADRSAKTKAGENAKKIEIAERRLKLLERAAAQAEQTKEVLNDTALSDEQRAQRIKEIYGRA